MEYVDFDLAKKLKEKGFREKVNAYYGKHENIFEVHPSLDMNDCGYSCSAPTISQVLKWFRDEKNIYCLPWFEQGVDMWFYAICKPFYGCEFPEFMSKSDYDTYEQAVIAGIEYVLNKII